MELKQDFIKKHLKYREPFLFVDEACVLDDDKIVGKYKLKKDAYFLKGHFPEYPVLPGVLLVEMISQVALLHIIAKELKENPLAKCDYDAYLAKLNEFNFKSKIEPEADIEIKVEVKPSLIANFFEATGKVFEDNKLKCFGSMILYFKTKD